MGLYIPAWLSRQLPSQCMVCGSWPAEVMCSDCLARFHHNAKRCHTCALRLPDTATGGQCGQCLLHPPLLKHCLAAVDYGYPWASLLTQWKFQANPALTRHLAQWVLQLPTWMALRSPCTVTIPVPLAPQRLRERGYNQSLLLAQALNCPNIHHQFLQRTHDTPTQVQQGRAARLHNLRGAFAVAPAHHASIAGHTMLLVDDVITTGATLHAAAQALLAAGATEVHAIALARTP